MANVTFDSKWQEAMGELNEQVHIEDHTLDDIDGQVSQPPPQATMLEAFQHFACLYLKYMQIFSRLEECYDQMLHPQKRIDVKQVLEVVMARVVELKHELVKWNPPNPDVKTDPERNFPWEYVNLDDILVDLKLPPETLNVPIPRYFLEDNAAVLKKRDRLVTGYMKLKLGSDTLYLDTLEHNIDFGDTLSVDEAIQLIQRNERGRQGKLRGALVKELREEEKNRRMYDSSQSTEMDPEIAAANIQRLYRGFNSRASASQERDDELVFIGMKPAKNESNELEEELKVVRLKRKAEQAENREEYAKALVELKDVVKDEEGPFMRDRMMEERREWLTQVMGTGNVPENLEGYYTMKNPPDENAEGKIDDPAEAKSDDKKGSKKKDKKDKKEKKDKKGGKGDKKKGEEEEKIDLPPPLTGPTEITSTLVQCVDQYESVWLERDETDNFYQKHDVQLAKDVVREPVEEEVRKQVDELLLLQLSNIKVQLEAAAAGGKKKKKGKGGGKKGGKKKGKGGKKKEKKGKKGKAKALPGDKISELKGRSTDTMLSILIEHQIVQNVHKFELGQLIGDFNYLGSAYLNSEKRDVFGNWIPQDPSIPQLQQNLTEYAILPLGCQYIRNKTPLVRSILLYGAKGTGKTMAVSAIVNQTGGLLLNLSPGNLVGKFGGKNGPTKVVHMAFMLAKDPAMQPVVIYIDECEQVFNGGGKKKSSSDGPSRFKKDLIAYIKCIGKEDRVIVLGTSGDPCAGDLKEMRSFFEKHLYFPYPDYSSRVMLWRGCIKKTLDEQSSRLNMKSNLPEDFDISTLAHISEGYSSGSICKTVEETLTRRRVERMDKRKLQEDEFINCLARQVLTFADDNEKFRTFTAAITGLKETRDGIRKALAGDDGEGDDKKKKKDGKKKKGKK